MRANRSGWSGAYTSTCSPSPTGDRRARTHRHRRSCTWRHSAARVPGDLRRVVAREVARPRACPTAASRCRAAPSAAPACCRASSLRASISASRLGVRAAERAQREAVQVLEQLALPGVPHLGAGAADVGHRQQVQRGQAALVAHALGEARRSRRGRTGPPSARCGSSSGGAAPGTRSACASSRSISCSRQKRRTSRAPSVGVVAAAALGDVVEQRRDVEDPRLVPAARRAASRTGTRARARG